MCWIIQYSPSPRRVKDKRFQKCLNNVGLEYLKFHFHENCVTVMNKEQFNIGWFCDEQSLEIRDLGG